jgi:hypothetical protein
VERNKDSLFDSSAIKALALVVLSRVFLEEVVKGLDKHIAATLL